MILESIEQAIERLTRRVHFRIVSRLHPDLTRLDDEDDRLWAMWYAADAAPSWQRHLSSALLVGVGPLAGIVAAFVLASTLGLGTRWTWPLVLAGGAVGGYLVTTGVVETFRRRTIRLRHFAAMRIFGHDVCPRCGYDMTGHAPRGHERRTCPECGGAVPPPRDGERVARRAA